MRRLPVLACLLVAMVSVGCAHHKLGGDGYAYQPPLAPAVYPQPIDTTQPIAPVVTTGAPVVGQTAMPATTAPQVVMPQPVAGQPVYAPMTGATTVPCDPAMMQAPIQTQPCPPPAL